MAPTGGFDAQFIEDVRAHSDLVAVVSEYVSLRRAGKDYLGLCPFHQEKTPSFHVSPERQLFYCFGCHAGGDVFAFLMKKEGLDFTGAVAELARRAGIPLPDSHAAGPTHARRQRLLAVLDGAANLYHDILLHDEIATQARRYLQSRGIDQATVVRFRLGYAPQAWDTVVRWAQKQGYDVSDVVATGLAAPREHGQPGHYDRFRGRIMFPIFDVRGQVIAFGGRILPGAAEDEPKYLNSPETELFKKGHVLYPLHLAREKMRAGNRAVLVEGYMDAVTAHQAGFGEVVAGMGTALTPDQARLILGYCSEVVLAYDADTAGSQATLRGLEIFTQMGGRVRVATLPAEEDPDSLIRKKGPAAFGAVVESSRPLVEYLVDKAASELGESTVQSRAAVLKSLAPTLAAVSDLAERESYLAMVAKRLGFTTEVVRAEVARGAAPKKTDSRTGHRAEHIQRQARNTNGDVFDTKTGNIGATDRTEADVRFVAQELLELAFTYPEVAEAVASKLSAEPDVWPDPAMRALAEAAAASWQSRHTIDAKAVLIQVGDNPEAQAVLARLFTKAARFSPDAAVRAAIECWDVLVERQKSDLATKLENELRQYIEQRELPPVEWFDNFRKVVPPGREGV